MIGHQELIIILVIIMILFGAKKLPELGRSLGQGMKEFKKSSKELLEDTDDEIPTKAPTDSTNASS